MRTTLIFIAMILATGCTLPSKSKGKIQPAPPPVHDNQTPISLSKPVISQRIAAQRMLDAQVAQGNVNVEGQVR